MRTHRASPGYSLLELMTALAIVAVVLALAAPTLSSWIDRATLQADARMLAGELRLMRQRALDRQGDIVVVAQGARSNELAASDGTRIELAPGTAAQIIAARGEGLVIAWHGAIHGGVRLSRRDLFTEIRADRLTGRVAIGAFK